MKYSFEIMAQIIEVLRLGFEDFGYKDIKVQISNSVQHGYEFHIKNKCLLILFLEEEKSKAFYLRQKKELFCVGFPKKNLGQSNSDLMNELGYDLAILVNLHELEKRDYSNSELKNQIKDFLEYFNDVLSAN